jgi:hypothetical protein
VTCFFLSFILQPQRHKHDICTSRDIIFYIFFFLTWGLIYNFFIGVHLGARSSLSVCSAEFLRTNLFIGLAQKNFYVAFLTILSVSVKIFIFLLF